MTVNPLDALPPRMRQLVAETEAREANEAELAEAARQDEADARRIMARHQEHVHIAATGYSQTEWRQAQQARVDALAASGWDPSAPLGSEHHPEVLIDGSSLTPNSSQAAVAQATRYATTTGIDAQLTRNADEAQAWRSPVMMRVRRAALEDEIRRKGGTVPPRRTGPVTSAAGGGALPLQVIPDRLGRAADYGDY